MKSGAALDTAFVSLESFTPATFKRWVNHRPSNDINRYELASGRIIMTPPASWDHAEIESKLNSILRAFVSKRPLGKVFGSSAGYQLPSGDILEPDASFISRQRWTRGPRPLPGQFLKIVPTLVVEILSPATTQRDRIEKKRIYEANGVDEYWIVDPSAKEITLCHLQSGNYDAGHRFQARQTLRSEALPGFAETTRAFFV